MADLPPAAMTQWDQIVARQHTRWAIRARSPYIGPGVHFCRASNPRLGESRPNLLIYISVAFTISPYPLTYCSSSLIDHMPVPMQRQAGLSSKLH